MTDWPSALLEAYKAQLSIGWEQVFYGRIAVQWEVLSAFATGQQMDTAAAPWTSQAIRQFWKFGLDLWAARNQMVHGNTGGPSIRDQTRVEATIRFCSGTYSQR